MKAAGDFMAFFDEKVLGGNFPSEDGSVIWGMSVKAHGSMRFRWNEINENRQSFLKKLAGEKHKICQIELCHSKKVFAVENETETENLKGDGIITVNKLIIPVVTVADCMPIYLYESRKGVFGVLHSGWKGTGIVQNALELSEKKYGTKNSDFKVVLGPHIKSCCYNVDYERYKYFRENFTAECTWLIENPKDKNFPYALSLEKANLAVLKKCGVPEENIIVRNECTCCFPGEKFGSSRRETMFLGKEISPEEKSRFMTVQAAFVRCELQ